METAFFEPLHPDCYTFCRGSCILCGLLQHPHEQNTFVCLVRLQLVQLAAKREGPSKVAVVLRPGRGMKAPRPPWKVTPS